MKKITSLILAVLMLVGCAAVLASCGGNKTVGVKVVDIPLTEEQYAFAVNKGNTELLGKLDTFLKKIKGDGTFDAIVDKYFGDGTPTAVASDDTLKNDGTQLVVATNAAFAPFEYKEGVNYYGVDMEIMSLFAKELGKTLYINNMEFDAVCLSVSSVGGTYEDENGQTVTVTGGVCDVAAAGLTVSDKRKEILDFSESYYNASQVLVVSEDDKTFDDCKTAEDVEKILNGLTDSTKVGVQNGTTGKLYCEGDADWGFAGFKFKTVGYANGSLAVQEIINKNISYVVIDEGPAKAITAKMNEAN